ncbi:hypothetical protein JHK82_045147 [Glycine max]|uniref:Tyrosine-specific transport protein n=1 Tax=Glycine soja TaxID=3848 RepID=A0A445GIY6_GLYSO|nr:hypothetical protein GLYMA_16G152166v4 [Glycine max]KAG5100095.1 hypothetical protein JHK82_045147 [Glycine max]RZB61181.1 hypothetical protein D0Y65_043784 [Glycine soja]
MLLSKPIFFSYKPFTCPKINGTVHFVGHITNLQTSYKTTIALIFITNGSNAPVTTNFAPCNAITFTTPSPEDNANNGNNANNPTKNEVPDETSKGKSFWGAVGLIIGIVVGPGMLALPSLTIKFGPFPSTIIILASWLYFISSIIIVAELRFDSMGEHGVEEVSFTSLATKTLGSGFGAFVALVYSTLSFSLLVGGLCCWYWIHFLSMVSRSECFACPFLVSSSCWNINFLFSI